MPPIMYDKSIDSRLTRVEQAVGRTEAQISQLASDLAVLKERIETMLNTLVEHQTALYGSSDHAGLIGQGETLEELKRALKGYGREPGMLSDIQRIAQKVESWEDSRKWLTRLVIGAIVAQIVVAFFLK